MSSTIYARALVIEDEAPLRKVLINALSEAGYEVFSAEHGEEGLAQALEHKPDVIVTDLLMPRMGGTELLKRLRSDSWGKDVPVVILTNLSADSDELIKDVVTSAPDYYLVKADWSIYDVIEKVREATGFDD